MNEVKMYASAWCGYCARARALLERKGIRFDEIRVDGNREARREMETLSGRRSVPQIFIGDRHVGGSAELQALEQSGELDALLAQVPGTGSPLV
ncbi:MAG: glutaredoxin 3 [Gammaproteobacteria bacterium]|nr:glutaredoxin 3 [Gammaproteobacteria bacterium]